MSTAVSGIDPGLVEGGFGLARSFPNPFNPSTTIGYTIPVRGHVALSVFNSLGQLVSILQDGEQEAGYHEAMFNAQDLPSGVFFYRLDAGAFTQTSKCVLVR